MFGAEVGIKERDLIREFRLSPPGSGRGVSCDAGGAFIGAIPLLQRANTHRESRWEPRNCGELSKQIGRQFGLPIDITPKAGGIKAIANALNDDDIARAQVATVLLGIPDPPALVKDERSREMMIKFIRDLDWSGMLPADDLCLEPSLGPTISMQQVGKNELTKAGYNPNEPRGYHARWIHGDETNAASAATRSVTAQPSGPHRSNTTDDPTAGAAQRAARSQATPVRNQREGSERSFGSRLRHEAETALSEVGQAEVAESNSNLALASAGTHANTGWLRDFVNHIAKPWIELDGRPVQIPVINTGDPNSDAGAVIAHAILEPNDPLAHPGTNADRINALIGLASAGAIAAHPALGPAGAELPIPPDSVPPAIPKPFINLRARLPADLDTSRPIGRFEARDDLNDVDFGNYAHAEIGILLQKAVGTNVQLELNTAPYARGVDITVPEKFIDDVGFEYGEIKPLSRTGRSRFNNQVLNIWNLEGRVQPITYDRKGNIYYGFPGYDEP